NSGFQSFTVLDPTTGAQTRTYKPVSESNSGIFGARGSYRFTPQMAVEATFGFSPAGRSQSFFTTGFLTGDFGTRPVQVQPIGPTPVVFINPVLRDGNVYLYSGTLLTYLNRRGTWKPFFTVGAGGITRTSKIVFVQVVSPAPVGTVPVPVFSPTLIPATTRTDMALVLGVGFKKYLPRSLGVRMDFRDHINKFDQSTVNNMELSIGLFTRF
ncbi:MAG TPA: outer membrane beta-barrel protein, partial [Terriglobia bacterium]|nr:outer membrane beta-barrel protein [Terriglobia bacterium]